ncbi:toxin-antitoxin system HicB family antitoxin [Pelobacter propionicus]|uniref:HicB family protein n=1 Tax=Pelobacter propionicus (strain DSM 2379 / NBRC 103807 / OttBd1) TaxID=338966 RepID=A1AL75_PELPD|nr:toxin-antitoxin system HicB family antitoxin [Pelobacter propionicus]ABK98095.1 hypothetical protein Ppro_0463 [Pelobacter propionicus DSM 2379]
MHYPQRKVALLQKKAPPAQPSFQNREPSTIVAAVRVYKAFNCWITAQVDMGREIPALPHYDEESKPVKFVQRLLRSLHASIQARAKAEGVSINTLVLALIAEGLGRREGAPPGQPAKKN